MDSHHPHDDVQHPSSSRSQLRQPTNVDAAATSARPLSTAHIAAQTTSHPHGDTNMPSSPATDAHQRARPTVADDDMLADDLPDLQSVSDSSASDHDDDEADILDVEMTIAPAFDTDPDMPPLEPVPARFLAPAAPVIPSSTEPSAATTPSLADPPPDPATAGTGADAPRSDSRPVRPLPRNGPPPLRRHQFNPIFAALGGGNTTNPLPFELSSLFGPVFRQAVMTQLNGQQVPMPQPQPGAQPTTSAAQSANAPPAAVPDPDVPPLEPTPDTPAAAGGQDGQGANPQARHPPILLPDFMMSFIAPGIPQPQPTPQPIPIPTPSADGVPPTDGQERRHTAIPLVFENMIRNFISGEMNPFFMGHPVQEREDPERAKRLINGLEVVPHALVRRLERVGGVTGDNSGADLSGGEAGCAVCWDKLLDGDGVGFGPQKSQETVANADVTPSAEQETDISDPPLADLPVEDVPQGEQPKMVTLPCAHVFHASCLMPWFSRPGRTTCPTCRFNIDPENLTFTPRPIPRPNPRRRARSTPHDVDENGDHAAQPAPADRPSRTSATDTGTSDTADIPLTDPIPGAPDAAANAGEEGTPSGATPRGEWRTFNFGYGTPTDIGPGSQFFTVNFDVFINPVGDNVPTPQANAQQAPQGHPAEGVHPTAEPHNANQQGQAPPTFGFGTFGDFMQVFGTAIPATFEAAGIPHNAPRGPRQRKNWVPPPPPGLTLRQRVERKEREAGLRCSDVSCGYAPTDEDPLPEAPPSSKQLAIRPSPGSLSVATRVCEHTFHPACLVSAERVAGWGDGDSSIGPVQVACPVCRAVGVIDREDWEEGVQASS